MKPFEGDAAPARRNRDLYCVPGRGNEYRRRGADYRWRAVFSGGRALHSDRVALAPDSALFSGGDPVGRGLGLLALNLLRLFNMLVLLAETVAGGDAKKC